MIGWVSVKMKKDEEMDRDFPFSHQYMTWHAFYPHAHTVAAAESMRKVFCGCQWRKKQKKEEHMYREMRCLEKWINAFGVYNFNCTATTTTSLVHMKNKKNLYLGESRFGHVAHRSFVYVSTKENKMMVYFMFWHTTNKIFWFMSVVFHFSYKHTILLKDAILSVFRTAKKKRKTCR